MTAEKHRLKDLTQLDKQALVEIYEEFSPGLFRYAYRLLGNSDLAEECVSETFSRFLHALRGGHGPRINIKSYLYRVAHNWITDLYRREPPPPLSLEPDLHAGPSFNPSQVVAQQMEQERVRTALVQLPPEQRQVVTLRFLEEWSHEEVATLLGKTVDATRALQYRAMNTLRRLLLDEEN